MYTGSVVQATNNSIQFSRMLGFVYVLCGWHKYVNIFKTACIAAVAIKSFLLHTSTAHIVDIGHFNPIKSIDKNNIG